MKLLRNCQTHPPSHFSISEVIYLAVKNFKHVLSHWICTNARFSEFSFVKDFESVRNGQPWCARYFASSTSSYQVCLSFFGIKPLYLQQGDGTEGMHCSKVSEEKTMSMHNSYNVIIFKIVCALGNLTRRCMKVKLRSYYFLFFYAGFNASFAPIRCSYSLRLRVISGFYLRRLRVFIEAMIDRTINIDHITTKISISALLLMGWSVLYLNSNYIWWKISPKFRSSERYNFIFSCFKWACDLCFLGLRIE